MIHVYHGPHGNACDGQLSFGEPTEGEEGQYKAYFSCGDIDGRRFEGLGRLRFHEGSVLEAEP